MPSGYLPVSHGHHIYYETHGQSHRKPVVILHGGPGGGSDAADRKVYDLKQWYVIQFDQRGCGKSTPFASLEHNTTWDLIEDMEALRKHLDLDTWFIAGGSWGTTLGLVYAEQYPQRVTGLLLRGLCLCNEASQKWLFEEGGASTIYPDEWEKFLSVIPKRLHHTGWRTIVRYFQKKLNGPDPQPYADAWWGWECHLAHLRPFHDRTTKKEALALSKIENHYFIHDVWLQENQIIKNAVALRNIPITIVHGRYDMVCPLQGAFDFMEAAPHARLIIIPDAGHASSEPGIAKGLRHAAHGMIGRRQTRKRRE